MFKALAWTEMVLASFCVAMFLWPLSGFCSGRYAGHDCESWFIFGVNLFLPLGLLVFVGASWSLAKRSWAPQYFILFGSVLVMAYWFSQAG